MVFFGLIPRVLRPGALVAAPRWCYEVYWVDASGGTETTVGRYGWAALVAMGEFGGRGGR